MATDIEKAAVQKLAHVPPGEAVTFTTEEIVVLRRMIRIVRGLDALGWLGSGVKNVIFWAGGMFLAYYALSDWVMKALGKK